MSLQRLKTDFENREELIAHVASISPHIADRSFSSTLGGEKPGQAALAAINPAKYAQTRNYLDGDVSRLSPYIRHGIITLNDVRNHALSISGEPKQTEKFIQELAWRDYWQRRYRQNPHDIWHDIEAYKTGFTADDYAETLPADIEAGETGVAVIDHFIHELCSTGYLHNHARMYVAAYVVHWRRIKWQAGAQWFLHHLLDGDPASNNLSWQWVASTFANKPYFFNLENVSKYASADLNVSPQDNAPLAYSYEELDSMLFPHREVDNG
ncbi:MAG: FAD-binding domain-containing protein [Candidatus Puniceispirillum sp.]